MAQPDSEEAVLLICDTHYGEETPTYNPAVLDERLRRCFAKTRELRELETSSRRAIKKLTVCLLGDMPDGSGIYPNQAHNQCVSNPLQQIQELSDMLASMLLAEAEYWDGGLSVEATAGNHGRLSKFAADQANFDFDFYDRLRLKLAGKVAVGYNTDGDVTARKINILGHDILLHHGHNIPMTSRTPWYGLENSALSWQLTKYGPFSMLACGHFHVCGLDGMSNGFDIFLNGTPVTDDPFPRAKCKRDAINKFWYFGVSRKRLVTWDYRILLV